MSSGNPQSTANAGSGASRDDDALREAGAFQRRYQILAMVAPVGIYHTTAEGRCVYVNERWCELTGISSTEALGEGWVRSLHPEDREAVFKEWSCAVQERRVFKMEYRYLRPDGRLTWVLGLAKAELDASGQTVGYVGTVTDISEQKRAEQVAATFAELGRQLGAVSSRRSAAEVVLAVIDRLFPLDAMLLHMLSEDHRHVFRVLTVDTVHGRRVEQIGEEAVAGPSAMFQRVVTQGAQLVLRGASVRTDVPLEPFGDAARASASLMFVPVHAGGRVIGVLSVQSYTAGAYDAGSLKLLQSLADYVGTGLARVGAHDESDRLSRLLLETQRVARLGCFEGDLLTGLDHWSDEAYRQMGYAPGEVTASLPNFLARVHPEDRERIGRSVEQIAWDGRPFEAEYRLVSPDGTVRHINAAVAAETTGDGRVVRVYGAAQDITRQKQTESELRSTQAELEERVRARTADLQAVFNALPDLIFRLRTDGVILDFKAEKSSSLYVAPEKFLGRRMQDVLPADVGRQFDEAIRQAAGQASGAELEYKLPLAEGLREFEARIVPASSGQLLLIVRDITERKAIEAALRDNKAYLRTVIDSTPDWIFVKDREFRYRMANEGYAKAFQLQPQDFIGKTDLELGLPEDLVLGDPARGIRGFRTDDREVMETGQMKVIPEEPGMAAGSPVFLSTVKVPLLDAGGNVVGVLGYVRDITERKSVEAERERLIGELQAALAEVKTLSGLLPVCGWCKKIRDDSGYWNSVEGYLKKSSGMDITHGICPDCSAKLMVDLDKVDGPSPGTP